MWLTWYSLPQLNESEETDVEVTWEDQEKINTFSKLNSRLQDLEENYEEKKKEKEYLEDLASELELADEDELVKFRIGDSFFSIRLDEAQERIESQGAELETDLKAIRDELEGIESKMTDLKALLYAKFGKSINLER
ncbi:Prefoldin subunit-domain-containing protein [Polychytrium aggregatum]|uniref:Prefoldin subunit-domain-containing protein n=1 Tax=Polychytrium aggregatum TaxID=110093 RepID=UPI0022FE58D9|nr:Prefoldin subunit-domain-containing protein [Polychytrium aggregatum]KAI9207234.1 Prefoldin subunit-domain-containing protein [Polychytrium aggregatum]